ncbi:MAG: NADPH-dependent F420 reductase [Nitriliruptoraceae bacterium]
MAMEQRIGIIGGTGPMGRGLAARLARAGVEIQIGSREVSRGEATARELTARLGEDAAGIGGGSNADAARCAIVVLAVPFDSLEATLDTIEGSVGEALIVSTVNPLAFDAAGPRPLVLEAGSAAEYIASRFPASRVVAAFNTVAGPVLNDLEHPVEDDVLVAGDDPEAVEAVVALADRIEGARGVAAGKLRLAVVLESLTPVLISVNSRYRTHAGVRLSRLTTS